jgi:ankyrin repeat protein
MPVSHVSETLSDPVAAFIRAATVPREAHSAGTLDEADAILARYPHVGDSNVHTAAILADEARVRACLAEDPGCVSATSGPDGSDALTHLCFSRYLRLDRSRSDAFVSTARALLDAGANPNTGWYETIDYPNPRQVIEAAIYGAAGIAQHVGLTRLLLERGADPNDEETPYHVPETYDNTVLRILLDSGRFNPTSLSWLLLRKCDWHDLDGLRLVLDRGGDPNAIPRFGRSAFHHALVRDNSIEAITLLLDRGADPSLRDSTGRSAIEIAARRGRSDVLRLFTKRGMPIDLHGVDRLIATCALDDGKGIVTLLEQEPGLKHELMERGGTLLAEFSGTGNAQGVRNLLELGIAVDALYTGDPYFDIAKDSTALHVAAWRASHEVVPALIARGAPVDARDGKGRTPMMLAVKACVDSYWQRLRRPDSVKALLDAGASADGIELPCGYDEVDALLMS